MSNPEAFQDPFNIDPLIPEAGKDQFNRKIDEIKAEGYTEARTAYFTLEGDADLSSALKDFKVEDGEEIVASYKQEDNMEDSAEANDKPQHIVYVLVAKKA